MKLHLPTRRAVLSAVGLIMLAGLGEPALAQGSSASQQSSGSTGGTSSAASTAIKHVDDAAAVVRTLASDTSISRLLSQARGIYIMPRYGRAALGLGAAGGAGVFSEKRTDGTWSDPAFFNTGGISVGLQAGVEGGPVALLLMNDKALNSFRQKNNFNLSADAGLTVVNWRAQAQGQAGAGDVVVWTGSKGLFGNVATLAINDIRYNQKATQAYYGKALTVQDVVSGKVSSPHSDTLKQALSGAGGAAAR
ncbi:lipid-binding SYLF domain-containing protein [Massilia agilis]|uniref:Lipid-binding SYLF domain-containing protein n=1 Tax=Massilia agilis TaxID=1811226 RepID=A0ABT2D6A0_9BURK|nr:lipid-binding SYLF domain-containing protein [Massilia agilis]MCS0806329.1 lipid-binding SYLF domain-containing protein [Massilia agilis]